MWEGETGLNVPLTPTINTPLVEYAIGVFWFQGNTEISEQAYKESFFLATPGQELVVEASSKDKGPRKKFSSTVRRDVDQATDVPYRDLSAR